MKSIICLTILAFAVACVLSCDPDSDNKPICISSNLNVPIRNFWDPTHYWLCSAAGAVADSVACPIAEGFDAAQGACIPFTVWTWATPCPENATN